MIFYSTSLSPELDTQRVLATRSELIEPSADFHFDGMLLTIVPEGNCLSGYFLSIEGQQILVGRISGEPGDRDVINGLAVAVMDFTGRPAFRQTRS